MAVDLHKLHENAVDRNPEVWKDKSPTEHTNKLVVVGYLFVVLKAACCTGKDVERYEDPAADLWVAKDWENSNNWAVNNEDHLETGLQTAQAIILDRLRLVVEHGYYQTCGKEQHQEKYAGNDVENVNALVTLEGLYYIMVSVVTIQNWYETLKEREIEYPIQENYLISQEPHCGLNILLLTVSQSEMHINDETND